MKPNWSSFLLRSPWLNNRNQFKIVSDNKTAAPACKSKSYHKKLGWFVIDFSSRLPSPIDNRREARNSALRASKKYDEARAVYTKKGFNLGPGACSALLICSCFQRKGEKRDFLTRPAGKVEAEKGKFQYWQSRVFRCNFRLGAVVDVSEKLFFRVLVALLKPWNVHVHNELLGDVSCIRTRNLIESSAAFLLPVCSACSHLTTSFRESTKSCIIIAFVRNSTVKFDSRPLSSSHHVERLIASQSLYNVSTRLRAFQWRSVNALLCHIFSMTVWSDLSPRVAYMLLTMSRTLSWKNWAEWGLEMEQPLGWQLIEPKFLAAKWNFFFLFLRWSLFTPSETTKRNSFASKPGWVVAKSKTSCADVMWMAWMECANEREKL